MIKFSKRTQAASRQRGQGMSEYIIIVALIAVGAIGVFTAFGGTIRHQVAGMSHELAGESGKAEVGLAKTDGADKAKSAAAKVTNMGTYTDQNK